jgi:tetratricopeptide (TPR) repeat protein
LVAIALLLGIAGTTAGLLWALDQRERATSAELATKRELTRANEVKRLITEMLANVNPAMARGADITLLKRILDDTARRLARGEITDELIAAELHNVIGVVYRDLGLLDEADRHIPIAMEIRTRLLGEEHPLTLQSRLEQVALDGEHHRIADMEPVILDLLEKCKRTLGPEHPDTLRSMEALTRLYASQGRLAEAEPLLVKTLEARRRVLGNEHRDTLTSLSQMGFLDAVLGRTAEAERLIREALEHRERVLGKDHPDTLVSMQNLMMFLKTQGRYEESESILKELTDHARLVLGEQHPYVLLLLSEFGPIYEKLGRYDDVCAAYETELRVRRETKGVAHPRTWRTMRALADAYLRVGRDDKAVTLCRELLEHLPTVATDSEAPSIALFTVAWVLTRDLEELRNPDLAVEFAQHAVTIAQERNKRREHQYLNVLALAQHQAGDTARAIETQKRAISLMPEKFDEVIRAEYDDNLRTYEAAMEAQSGEAAADKVDR